VHYVAVVTAVTELGHGKPKFYSTPEVIAFCRKWRLPTNHVWLFSTRYPPITLGSGTLHYIKNLAALFHVKYIYIFIKIE
jgi:hypothetical protein